jgi:protein-S-isoprenylcysteine O-methyltransferase Ste14
MAQYIPPYLRGGVALTIAMVCGSAVFVRRTFQEEGMLRDKFGRTWDEYRKKTWSLIPLIW